MAERRPDRVLGGNHDEFWAGCDQGELRLQRCTACGQLSWPVVESCEYCADDHLNWERLSGRGKLVSWCRFERDYLRGALPIPWDTILVELDEGPLFISNPASDGSHAFLLEQRVSVEFLDCEDSHGAFKLPVFRPV